MTIREAQQVAKYLVKHRKQFKTHEEVQTAFNDFIRKIRGDNNNA